jgi:hypothetical protein
VVLEEEEKKAEWKETNCSERRFSLKSEQRSHNVTRFYFNFNPFNENQFSLKFHSDFFLLIPMNCQSISPSILILIFNKIPKNKKIQKITCVELRGLYPAALTGFKDDGNLNLEVIDQQLELMLRSGCQGVFVSGTTGESISMSENERKQLVERWVKAIEKQNLKGRFKLILQVGCAGKFSLLFSLNMRLKNKFIDDWIL